MKLHNWTIMSALAAGDQLAAVNAAAEIFNLPPFAADSEAFVNRTIHDVEREDSSWQEIRIATGGHMFSWSARGTDSRLSIVAKDTWIAMWLCPINR
jgi:hypothetical protein